MDDSPDIILLTNDSGERVGFRPVAAVMYEGAPYMILQPVTPMEGAEEGDAFVFSVSRIDGDREADSGDFLAMETDKAVINAVFDLYEKS